MCRTRFSLPSSSNHSQNTIASNFISLSHQKKKRKQNSNKIFIYFPVQANIDFTITAGRAAEASEIQTKKIQVQNTQFFFCPDKTTTKNGQKFESGQPIHKGRIKFAKENEHCSQKMNSRKTFIHRNKHYLIRGQHE